jgi:hypothetical protein
MHLLLLLFQQLVVFAAALPYPSNFDKVSTVALGF